MSIFEKLSSTDCDKIQAYIESFGGYDADEICLKAPLSHILRFWNNNKQNLHTVFGGEEPILSKEVSFVKPLALIEDEVCEMMNYGGGRSFHNKYDCWARSRNYNEHRYELAGLLNCSTLAKNTYEGESFIITTPDNKTIAINNGCKVSKVLGKIAAAFKIPDYEEFRIAHSLCLNQKTLKGELCISIHPLDYMTMSDNNCGWDSCMSWQQPGDYRMGTVEMMNSPYVVVAYLRSSEDMNFDGYTWNSKKWRQLFIVSPELIVGIRQYPYNNDELSGITLKWLRELAERNAKWGPYSDTAVNVDNYATNVFANIGKEVYIELTTHMMYNDLHRGHLGFVSECIPKNFYICFSGETECMKCGKDVTNDEYEHDDTSALVCNQCENIVKCCECGDRIHNDDGVVLEDGSTVCRYCYDNYYVECDFCEEIHHESQNCRIFIEDERGELTSYSFNACDCCINSDKFLNLFGATYEHQISIWSSRTVVSLKKMTLEGLDYVDVWVESDYERFKSYIESRAKTEI